MSDLETVESLRARPGVFGVALYRGPESISANGELSPFGLEEVALAARHVLRETQPAIDHLEFVFSERRLVVASSADGLLFVLVDPTTRPSELLAASPLGAPLPGAVTEASVVAPAPAPPASEPVDPVTVAQLIHAANAVIAALKRSVGGAVLRNYFGKVQRERSETTPALAAVSADLTGELRLKDAQVDPVALGAALGFGLAELVKRLAVVAPEVTALDLRAETAAAASTRALERAGFFEEGPSRKGRGDQ
jgi:hypothetical protein